MQPNNRIKKYIAVISVYKAGERVYVLGTLPFYSWGNWQSEKFRNLPSIGVLGCGRGLLVASSGSGPGMLLNILQCTGQS